MFAVNKNPTTQEIKKFGVAMLIGFGVLGALVWYLHARKGELGLTVWDGSAAQIVAIVIWAVGGLCFVVSLVSPRAARILYVGWMTITVPIGLFMSTVLLTVLFVVILPVFALIVRFGDPLRMKLTTGGTYWEDYKPYEPTLERMRRPF